MNRRTLLLTALLIIACAAPAQPIQTGFLDRSILVDGVEFRYQVYVPRDFQPSKAWPVIVVLHGGGTYASDGISQTEGGLGSVIRRHPDRFPALVVFPQAHPDGTPGWQQKGGEAALAELDKTLVEFNGDPSRVYLTGFSAGGNGAWFLASHHPDRFAALVVICGFVSEFKGKTSPVPLSRHRPRLSSGSDTPTWPSRSPPYPSGSSTETSTRTYLWRSRERWQPPSRPSEPTSSTPSSPASTTTPGTEPTTAQT